MAFDHNLIQLPSYQFAKRNLNDKVKLPALLDHKKTNLLAIDYSLEKQSDFPLRPVLKKGEFQHEYMLYYFLYHNYLI